MNYDSVQALFPTLGSLLAIGGLATFLAYWLGLEQPWLQPWAILRATVQLAILSFILSGVLTSLWLTGAFLLVMVTIAALTIAQRIHRPLYDVPLIANVVTIAVSIPIALVFMTGALPIEGRYLLSLGGILIGHSMIASSLMGREVAQRLTSDVEEIEGWLAIGAPMRHATRRVMRRAGSTAVIAGTDQTRNIGVVTLPGAFVGAIFGGANVIEAGRFQLLVSASILLVQILVVMMWMYILGNPKSIPRED